MFFKCLGLKTSASEKQDDCTDDCLVHKHTAFCFFKCSSSLEKLEKKNTDAGFCSHVPAVPLRAAAETSPNAAI